jgi:hypothetical protein
MNEGSKASVVAWGSPIVHWENCEPTTVNGYNNLSTCAVSFWIKLFNILLSH